MAGPRGGDAFNNVPPAVIADICGHGPERMGCARRCRPQQLIAFKNSIFCRLAFLRNGRKALFGHLRTLEMRYQAVIRALL
mgnify:CR=1 FL=1